ncbi:hypothetical protein KSP40_PGU000965 [Platanthera guangdongensis]|uniref:Uncharacterized protein n=1 Tax=Platanthera guangdongensis TaxID=2320717 RepID=A0ABR2M3Y1_9ASPA
MVRVFYISRTDFTIVNFDGEVKYQAHHFINKNKDYVVTECQDFLSPLSYKSSPVKNCNCTC